MTCALAPNWPKVIVLETVSMFVLAGKLNTHLIESTHREHRSKRPESMCDDLAPP